MTLKRRLFDSDHQIFREAFRSFLAKEVIPHQKDWEAAGIVPKSVWKKCGENGFLVPAAPAEHGGLGLDDFRYEVVMMEELAYANETGLMLGLHSSVIAPYILNYANEEQKARWVPGIVSGETVLAVAMTEPGAGSDLAGIKTTAVDKGDHWELNGSKTFISNAINAGLVIVVARTDTEQTHKLGLFVVEGDPQGFERGAPLKKIGLKSQDTAELFFNNVKIPKENVLGNASSAFSYLLAQLPVERLTLCVAAVAGAEAALKLTIDYVQQRKAFGKAISQFQNTKFKCAEMHTEINIARVYVDRMIEAHMAKELTADEACGAKYWTTDLLCRVTDECLQLHGGYGYMEEYPISKMYTDARITKIYAGTNEIMKVVVAQAMGL